MRSFILSLLFLFAVTAGVLFNAHYAIGVYDELLDKLESLPEAHVLDTNSGIAAAESAGEYLDSKLGYLLFTLPSHSVTELTCDFSDLLSHVRDGEKLGYSAALSRVKLRVKDLRRSESFFLYELIFPTDESKKRYFP